MRFPEFGAPKVRMESCLAVQPLRGFAGPSLWVRTSALKTPLSTSAHEVTTRSRASIELRQPQEAQAMEFLKYHSSTVMGKINSNAFL
jgi:hypothetical protein